MQAPFRAALYTVITSMFLLAIPFVLGRTDINKYFVLFGFLGLLLSVSLAAHGLIDRFRGS